MSVKVLSRFLIMEASVLELLSELLLNAGDAFGEDFGVSPYELRLFVQSLANAIFGQ